MESGAEVFFALNILLDSKSATQNTHSLTLDSEIKTQIKCDRNSLTLQTE